MISADKLINKLKFLRMFYLNIEISTAIKYSIMLLILIFALYIRLMPLKYGAYVSEFDPYLQFYGTNVIVKGFEEKGIFGIFDFFKHHIDLTWQPRGVDLGKVYFPGVPYFGAITYIFLKTLGIGVSLVDVAVYLPVFFGILAVFFIYLIGKEIGGEFTGFIASFFYAVSPSVIPRSNLGWYDTDGLGMPLLIMSLYFFLKSMKSKETYNKILFSIIAGLLAGALGGTWGGFIYLYGMYALFTIILVIFDELPPSYEITYLPMILITSVIVNNVPRNDVTYLTGALAFVQYIAIILVIISKYIDIKSTYRTLVRFISLIFLLTTLAFIILPVIPIKISGRYLAVLLPMYEELPTIVKTVQEQAGASFVYIFRGIFILLPFSIYGFYLCIKEKSYDKLFIGIFALTSAYLASNMVRLIVLSTPFIILLGGYGIKNIFSTLYEKLSIPMSKHKGKYHEEPSTLKTQVIIVSLVIILLGTYYSYNVGVRGASYPVTILTGGAPLNPVQPTSYDWFEALEWIKANVQEDEIIAAWWDYGYWISFIAGKKSLADNGTINSTRIALLAEMFLSNESHAIEIMKELGAKYVLIYIGSIDVSQQQPNTFFVLRGFGEEGKFLQMARILGIDRNKFLNLNNTETSIYKDAFWQTFLGKLIPYEFLQKDRGVEIYRYTPKYPMSDDGSSKLILVYRTTDPGWGEVVIYKLVDE